MLRAFLVFVFQVEFHFKIGVKTNRTVQVLKYSCFIEISAEKRGCTRKIQPAPSEVLYLLKQLQVKNTLYQKTKKSATDGSARDVMTKLRHL